MELNIIQSNTTSGAIHNGIALLGKKNVSVHTQHIVIVPDRFSLSQEQEIYKLLNLSGSFNIEVMSFARLADKMVTLPKKFLSKEGTVMLMKKILQQNLDKLSHFNKLNISYGFAREIFAVIASLRSSGITAKMLMASADNYRREKFQDLAVVYSLYETELKKGYADSLLRYEHLWQEVATNKLVADTNFYVFGFNVFSEMQERVIQQLCLYSLGVTIAFATDSQGANKDIFPYMQVERWVEFARQNNIKLNNQYIFQRLSPPFDAINKELFAFTKVDSNSIINKNAVQLFRQKNAYEEMRVVAKEITLLVKNGARYKDIAIVCCQQEYNKCISSIFDKFEIPYFIDEKYPASQSIDARYIFYLLDVILSNFNFYAVMNLIKHPYFSLSIAECNLFENYCLKYNVNHSIFNKPFEFGEDIESLESIRLRLCQLITAVKTDGDTAQLTNSLLEIVEKNTEIEEDESILYNASLQARAKIIELLREIKEVLGAEKVELEDYYYILTEGVGSLENALIPQYIDAVFVGNTNESRFSDIQYLFVVGANEGFFPAKIGEQTILSYADMLHLKKCNLPIYPDPIEVNRLEKFIVTDLVSRAEKLYISCSDYSITGEMLLLGEVIKELSYILGMEIKREIVHSHLSDTQQLFYNLGSVENAYYEFVMGRVQPQFLHTVEKFLVANGYDILNKENLSSKECNFAERLFLANKSGEGYTTKVSQLESYFRCPYSHFLSYGLRLKEREVAGLRVVDIGNIIHEVLERFFEQNIARLKQLDEEQIHKESQNAITYALANYGVDKLHIDALNQNRINKVVEECLYVIKVLVERIHNSNFSPKYIELAFDEYNKLFQTMKINTKFGGFRLRGKIDRVDTYNKKVAVIDYKTGGQGDEKLKYIYCGKKIQLYVYMSILAKNGYQPAGAFYLPIRDGYKSTQERLRLAGQVEGDIDTLMEFDNSLSRQLEESFGNTVQSLWLPVSVKRNKQGEIVANNNKSLVKINDFMNIITYVHSLIQKAIEEICSGYYGKSPLEQECKFCKYKSHCDESKVQARLVDTVSLEMFQNRSEEE